MHIYNEMISNKETNMKWLALYTCQMVLDDIKSINDNKLKIFYELQTHSLMHKD
jgi:hypothetical protein